MHVRLLVLVRVLVCVAMLRKTAPRKNSYLGGGGTTTCRRTCLSFFRIREVGRALYSGCRASWRVWVCVCGGGVATMCQAHV